MVKKIAAVAVLVAGMSWAAPAAMADNHARTGATATATATATVDAEARAIVKAVPGTAVRTYDLHKRADVCALLTLILGLNVAVGADVHTHAGAGASVSH